MKKVFAVVLAVVMLVTMGGVALADKPPSGEDIVGNPTYDGNGAPSGYHFTLNIIGVQKTKSADMTYEDGSNRSSIFVKLDGKSRIYLYDGGTFETQAEFKDAFAVLDANGTDGTAAFQLPNPGLDPYVIGETDMETVDHVADYLIVARPLGKPGGFATMTTCAELTESTLFGMLPNSEQKEIRNLIDDYTGAYISVQSVPAAFTFRDTGKSKFENVTAYLLTIVFEVDLLDADGNVIATYFVRVPIFDEMLENEYWLYDNNKLKLLQVRFYPMPTDITYADEGLDPIIPD